MPREDSEDIDVVYTWVDGEKLEYAVRARLHATDRTQLNPERFRDTGLLRYSLRSLAKNLAWKPRHIYLVTQAPQVPRWLDRGHPQIRVVHHDEIFADARHLPTFSSNAIELQLHRIADLSPRFVYLNDDFLLGRRVTRDDFLSPDGRARYAPRGGRNEHLPHLIERTLVEEMIAEDPALAEELLAAKFRQSSYFPLDTWYRDFLVCRDLGAPYEDAYLWRNKVTLTLGEDAHLGGWNVGRTWVYRTAVRLAFLYCAIAKPKFLCINDDFGVSPSDKFLQIVRDFCETMFPDPSPYELVGE